jgi:chromosome segregation ATPase
MSEKHERLKEAKKRMSVAETNLQRLQGRYRAALDEQARVEAECRAKNIAPDDLDRVIQTLEEQYRLKMAELEELLTGVEGQMAPYLEDLR